MARVYLSFLGTNDYVECFYFRKGFEMGRPVRFVQEATVLDKCREWGPEDRILIFTTREAEKRNWKNDGHINPKTGGPLKSKGLEACLRDLALPPPIFRHSIPDGHDEEQIWTIFDQVSRCFEEGDEVVFDITHAFRSIPMLAIVVLNYVKVLKGVRLQQFPEKREKSTRPLAEV